MRFSTSTNIYTRNERGPYSIPIEESVRVCAQAGFHYIDANLCVIAQPGFETSILCEDDWEKRIRRVRDLVDCLGAEIRQSHSWWYAKSPIPCEELPGGDFGEEMMRRSILASEILGVKWMVVHPISVTENGKRSREKTFAYNLQYLARWNKVCREHSVGMAVENMVGVHGNEWADVDFLIRLVDALDDPNVGICLDTGHANISGLDVAECVRKIGPRLHATHINDNYARGMDEHLAPFNGTVKWRKVLKALRETGYQDDFAYEIQNYTNMYPKELQPELIRFTYQLGQYMLTEL